MKIDELREEALQILEQNGLEQLEGAGGALEDHVFVALDLEDQAGAKLFAAHLRVTDVAMQKPDEEVARQIAEDQKVGAPLVRAFWLTTEQFAGWLRATQKAENLPKYDSFMAKTEPSELRLALVGGGRLVAEIQQFSAPPSPS